MSLTFKDIIVIDKDYLAYLYSFDNRVSINHANSKDRPNVAVLVDKDGQMWAIPMSHNKTRNSDATYNLYDYADRDDKGNPKHLGHVKINNMIPVFDGVYTSAFNSNDEKYLNLIGKQQTIIQGVLNTEIAPRFEDSFRCSKLAKTYPNNKFYQLFNDFVLLKEKSDMYKKVQEIYERTEYALACKPPNAEDIMIAFDEFYDINKEDRDKVLGYNKSAKKGIDIAEKAYSKIIEKEGWEFLGTRINEKDLGRE